MRYKAVFLTLFSLFWGTSNANWTKINDVDYTWGPFNIYHITLFTETGKYEEGTRPLMLTLQYKKPWEGRDFAVSLARTWNNLGIQLPEEEVNEVITRLRKNFPDIKPEDTLHYIALEDRGYFILNDKVVSDVFNKAFNDAIVAIWLDPKMDISHQLLDPSYQPKVKEEIAEQTLEPQTTQQEAPKNEAPVHDNQAASLMQTEETLPPSEAGTVVQEPPKQDATKNKAENRTESKTEDEAKSIHIENPELFILPIYDDFLMLQKHYI